MRSFKKLQGLKDAYTNAGRKSYIIAGIAIITILASVLLSATIFSKKEGESEAQIYEYNEIEQRIADETKAFLANHIELTDAASAKIADAAVHDYNTIMSSDIDIINDGHIDAIKQHMRTAMLALAENAESFTNDELEGLASGIAEIILNAILGQIEAATSSAKTEEYLYLAESIQKQITELSEQKQKLKISIQADLPASQPSIGLDAEALLAAVNGMTDSELQELAKALGISLDELLALINAKNADINKLLEDKLAMLKEEIEKEVRSEIQTASKDNSQNTNTTGRNGRDGKNGTDGKDGTDGKNGEDGKTTYIAYADDTNGNGFSLTPTETSKYVGTCITSANSQPQEYASYSNWQIYRTYIITTTVDENNVTTVHIN